MEECIKLKKSMIKHSMILSTVCNNIPSRSESSGAPIFYNPTNTPIMQITTEQHSALIELLEDTVSYYCDENMLSGELIYTIIEAYSAAKVAQLRGEVQ